MDNKFTAYLYDRRMIVREMIENNPDQQTVTNTQISIGGSDREGGHGSDENAPIIYYPNKSDIQQIVKCCHCSKIWGPYQSTNTTTSAFIRHFRDRHKGLPATEKDETMMLRAISNSASSNNPWTIASEAKASRAFGERFSKDKYRKLLSSMIIASNSSFRLVERPEFNDLIQYCTASVAPTLSHQTVARDINKLYQSYLPVMQAKIAQHLQSGQKIHMTLDAWTSSNKIPYLGITGHWMDAEFNVKECVLGFERLRGSHTAENLVTVFKSVLNIYRIGDRFLGITADNASVNKKMFDIVERDIDGWTREDGHIRCMAHIINLAAQKILQTLKAESQDDEVYLAEEEFASRDLTPAGVLRMTRQIISKIRSSNLLSEALSAQATAAKLKDLKLKLDMRIRWNSTHDMLQRFLYLRPAIERLIVFEDQLGPSGFNLTDEDWDLLTRISKVMDIFVIATKHLSQSHYPSLYLQLPYFNILLRGLKQIANNQNNRIDGNKALVIACTDGWTILNKYWNKVDDHSSQVICMILDPRLKLQIFKNLSWTSEYISEAKQKLERVYSSSYAHLTPPDTISPSELMENQSQHSPNDTDAFEDPLSDLLFGPVSLSTELTHSDTRAVFESRQYLQEPLEKRSVDTIKWWRLHKHRYPGLSRMAQDYLAIPAGSVLSERLFSKAGDIITKKRNRLLETSSTAMLLLQSWLGQEEVEHWELEQVEAIEEGVDSVDVLESGCLSDSD